MKVTPGFYRFYLSEHSNSWCRRMHFLGNTLVLAYFIFAVCTHRLHTLWLLLPLGYGPAWIGHFVFEKNRPASFKHPGKSLICDWMMYKDMLRGKVKF